MKHTHCLGPARAQASTYTATGTSAYKRMFPELPTFSADQAFIVALGGAGGVCDCTAQDDDEQSLGSEAAGWPFFGQFVAHDITADRSTLRATADPSRLRNARSPQLNLECLYGDGPIGHPFLFRRDDPAILLTAADGCDVLRNREGTAIIGDPRNDSHRLMSQMHLAFVHAHNHFVDEARRRHVAEPEVFDWAARELRWHYQTAVLQEFLPSLIGQDLTDTILRDGRAWYRPDGETFIPLEFADAAYRYGHSQIRHRYQINGTTPPRLMFPDLLGFRAVASEECVDWSLFFDVAGCPPAQRAKKIDGRLVSSLISLPAALTGDSDVREFHSLAVRDLERGESVGLPSGEAVARLIGERPLTRDDIGVAATGWRGETPLWFYLLREADVRCNGARLGPVGGRIVGEVLIGLLESDASSVRYAPDEWRPSAGLADLIIAAQQQI